MKFWAAYIPPLVEKSFTSRNLDFYFLFSRIYVALCIYVVYLSASLFLSSFESNNSKIWFNAAVSYVPLFAM